MGLRRLTERITRFFRMRTMRRLVLAYLVTFCIPLVVLLSLYYSQLFRKLVDDYTVSQRSEVLRAAGVCQSRADSILMLGTIFQQNPQFCEYVEGKFSRDSERVYNYNVYVMPYISYVLRTNHLLEDLQVYSLTPGFQTPPYHFLDRWPQGADSLQAVLGEPNPLAGQWHVAAEGGRIRALECYLRLYNGNYSQKLGILHLTIDPVRFWGDLRAPSDNTDFVLRIGDGWYRIEGEGFVRVEEPPGLDNFADSGEAVHTSLFGRSAVIHALPMEELGMEAYFITEFTMLTAKDIVTFLTPVLISLLLFTSIFFIYLSSGTGRILRFSHYVEHADYSRLQPYPLKGYGDEIDGLIGAYNKLVDNINRLINTVFQAQIKSREAQYYALQAQVNPHFLLNTLENIHMMAVINDDEETAKMILMLGKIFQYNIDKDNIFSTVDTEVLHACNYLELCKMRMGRKLHYSVSCSDGSVGPVTCPRNVIQPIVENCINHAFRTMDGQRVVRIDVRREGEDIVILVADNGSGIEDAVLQRLRRHLQTRSQPGTVESGRMGVGLRNVHERLELFYGEGYGLLLRRGEPRGTECVLRLRSSHQLEGLDHHGREEMSHACGCD